MGKVMNTNQQSNLAELLDQNVILELDRLTNADKILIVESMLLWIHHYRMAEQERETFKHTLILEEAHHILNRRTSGNETIIEQKNIQKNLERRFKQIKIITTNDQAYNKIKIAIDEQYINQIEIYRAQDLL
jgi:hypothetical protein